MVNGRGRDGTRDDAEVAKMSGRRFTDTGEPAKTTLTRRGFIRRLGVAAIGLAALPVLAACTHAAPATPTPDVPPTADPEPITPKPSPSLVVRQGERLSMLVTGTASLAADEQLQALATEWGHQNGIEVAIETVSAATVRSRLTTPQGTDGLDIVQCRDN